MKFRAYFITLLLFLMLGILSAGGAVSAAEREQQSDFVAPYAVVNTSFLNVRTGPGAQYTVLLTVVGGTELPILGIARDRVWYQVSTILGVGWVNSEFVVSRGDFGNVPFVEAPESFSLESARTSPNTQTGQRTQGDTVGGVTFGGVREWGITIDEAHPGRTQPTITAGSPGVIPANDDMIYQLLEFTANEGITWYRITDPSLGMMWVEADKTDVRPFACEFSAVRFTSPVAPKIGPDGSGTLDGEIALRVGEEAYLLDFQANQYKVELFDGNTGWVSVQDAEVREAGSLYSEFCATGGSRVVGGGTTTGGSTNGVGSPNRPTVTLPRAVINTGFLNIRSGPGAQYSVVTTLPGGAEVPIIGYAPDGVWYLVEDTFGRGWVNSEFILFRGDGSNLPIIRDFTGSAEIANPIAIITNAVTLYAAPNVTLGIVGALSGPLEVDVVARTEDFAWVQLSTDIGFGWVQVAGIQLQGDTGIIPVVNR